MLCFKPNGKISLSNYIKYHQPFDVTLSVLLPTQDCIFCVFM